MGGIPRALVLALAAVAIWAALAQGVDRNVAAITAGLALLSSAAGVLARASTAGNQARDLADAGKTGLALAGRVVGRPEELAVRTKAEELRRVEESKAQADAEADRLEAASAAVRELATDQPLGVLLDRLSTISEYRDRLSLVTRTRSYFSTVDNEVRAARTARAAMQSRPAGTDATDAADTTDAARRTAGGGPNLERVVIVIDDLDRCPPEKVISVLQAVHLLFDFELFVVLIAVDTRWLEQSLQIHYRQLLGRPGTARPTDYLEKIIQVPLHLLPLDETMVRAVISGLTGTPAAAQQIPPAEPIGPADAADPSRPATTSGPLIATIPRARRGTLPAEVMRISTREADAMAAVAPLVGTTPRTAKRFVNTYRLLKARAADPGRFDAAGAPVEGPGGPPGEGLGEHEVVALLLAIVTGRPQIASMVLRALDEATPQMTAEFVIGSLTRPDPVSSVGTKAASASATEQLTDVTRWLAAHPRYARAPADRYAPWVREVSRFSFSPLT
jgi:hypothetical protein